jgi:hypothetical protein
MHEYVSAPLNGKLRARVHNERDLRAPDDSKSFVDLFSHSAPRLAFLSYSHFSLLFEENFFCEATKRTKINNLNREP